MRQVLITVEDVNDETPRFDRLEYTVSMKENLDATDSSRQFLLKFDLCCLFFAIFFPNEVLYLDF